MGNCLDKIVHKKCGHNTLQVYAKEDGTTDGFCFFPGCMCYVEDPYGDGKLAKDIPKRKAGKSKKELAKEFAEIEECSVYDLVDRKLRADTLKHYGIKIGVNTKDGKTPKTAFFPYTENGKVVKYKIKLLDRKVMWSIGGGDDLDLFGWEQAKASGARRLIITEGEWDAVALTKILEIYTKPEYRDNIPAVCSLINGAGSAGRDLARLAPKIRRHFQDISFCFDNDDAGAIAVEAACKVFPEATSITLPSKDANQCIIDGTGKGAFSATMFRADKPKNSSLILADTLFEDARIPAEMGVSWPWDGMTDATRGIRTGETIYIAAGEKMG